MIQIVGEAFNECQQMDGTAARLIKQSANKLSKTFFKYSTDASLTEKFNESFFVCILRVLAVKKKAPAVERIIKMTVKFIERIQQNEQVEQVDEFLNHYLHLICRGIQSSEKAVRLRSCQLLAMSIDSINEIDDDVYKELRTLLLERVFDKDPPIRVQAVAALSKFQTDDEDGNEVITTLVYLVKTDVSVEVRKMILRNLDLRPTTKPFIVERIRDVDANIRKFVYKMMPEIGSFRDFSSEDRERILFWGLKDRDISVRRACEQMVAVNWIRECNDNIVEFLVELGTTDHSLIGLVLRAIFNVNPKIRLEFDDVFWGNLIAETVLLAKEYYRFCQEQGLEIDEILPQTLSFTTTINAVFTGLSKAEPEMKSGTELIGKSLLEIALMMDYSDEVCRREMLRCILNILSICSMGPESMNLLIELVSKLSSSQSEFIGYGLELIDAISDSADGQSTRRQLAILCAFMENISILNDSVENEELFQLLPNLVVPALTSATNGETQLAAIKALIHFCLINKTVAEQNLDFCLTIVDQSVNQVEKMMISALFDIIIVHGLTCFKVDAGVSSDKLFGLLASRLKALNGDIKIIAVKGFCKLLLLDVDIPTAVVSDLFKIYFDPKSLADDDNDVRQVLTLFFSVFPWSSAAHQKLIAQCLGDSIFDLFELAGHDLSVTQLAAQLMDWINPKQCQSNRYLSGFTHFALGVCRHAVGRSAGHIKAAFSILTKLPINYLDDTKAINEMFKILEELSEEIVDKTAAAAVKKFQLRLINGVKDGE